MFDLAIFMGYHVTLGNNATPGYFRVVCLKVRGYPVGSLTDNLQVAFHRPPQHPIKLVMMKCLPGNKLLYGFCSIPHIPQKCLIC